MKVVITLLLSIGFLNTAPPGYPQRFTQSIDETFTYGFIERKTKATIYYDWQSRRYRLDRDDGLWDRYCGTVYKFRSTPCTHFVSEGKRYLYYPEKEYCCMCCTAENGCGVLKPDWLSDAVFVKEFQKDNKTYEVWDKQGIQHNYVTAEKNSNRIVEINQEPNDLMEFDFDSYKEDFDQSLLDLPPICDPNNTCTKLSVCGPLQEEKQAAEI